MTDDGPLLLDVNVLIALAWPQHVHHARAHRSLTSPLIAMTRVITSRQVTDAHLLNVAASAGGRLASLDKGIADILEPVDSNRLFLLPA